MNKFWYVLLVIFFTFLFPQFITAQVIKDQTIYESLKSELNRLNKAKVEFDTDFIYEHSIDKYTGNVDKEEFEKGLDIAKMMMNKANIKITNTIFKEIGPIVFCEGEYQCLIKHEIIALRENKEFSVNGYCICVSQNSNYWYFQSLLEMDFEAVKSFYKKLCEEVNIIK